jgi:diadenosine tetraphosphate (Ap4A) HIT family hydrolase
MNPTVEKFGYPATLVREYDHWLVLLRPAQVTLGSLVLAAKSDATAYSGLSEAAICEQWRVVGDIERSLQEFVGYDKINYLMLMMVDREVHFHVIPRYKATKTWDGLEFPDCGWPKTPDLVAAVSLDSTQVARLAGQLQQIFC